MAEFEPITEHIQRLGVTWRLGPLAVPIAVFLVQTDAGFVLIDSGPPTTANEVVAAVARATAGRGPRSILLTHAHPDHAGGLAALRRAWNAGIICHRDEVPFVTGELQYRQLRARHLAYAIGRYFLSLPSARLPVARQLDADETVEGMSAIPLPGHSPGQVGFLHPADKAMLCGDAVGHYAGRLRPPPSVATWDMEMAQHSIARLARLDFDHLLPGHGPPILNNGRQAARSCLLRPSEAQAVDAW